MHNVTQGYGMEDRKLVFVLLFCLAIFALVALGFAVYHASNVALSFWSIAIYPIALLIIYVCIINPMRKEFKLSGRKIILLASSAFLTSVLATYSIWTIITPNWSFKVMTDKTNYLLGETVEITVVLENCGFITHSFTSLVSNPIIVSVRYIHPENPTVTPQVWCTPFHISKTKFTLAPHQSLEKKFFWDQTNIYNPEDKIETGTYLIEALVPSAESDIIGATNLFYAWTIINITAT